MRLLSAALVLLAALGCGGCFQLATVIRVKGDGSGTIEQRLVFTKQAVAQLQQLAVLGGREGFNPLSEEGARADAARLGTGVTLVSSTPIADDSGEGRLSVYAFTDINQVHVSQQPGVPQGAIRDLDPGAQPITTTLAREANGNALLTIVVPQPAVPGARASSRPDGNVPSLEQIEMLKQMFSGARVSFSVEPAGTLVKTNSTYVDGQRVTLMDVDLDQLMQDATLPDRLRTAKTVDEMKALLKDAPGLKVNFDREVTIEFTPAQ